MWEWVWASVLSCPLRTPPPWPPSLVVLGPGPSKRDGALPGTQGPRHVQGGLPAGQLVGPPSVTATSSAVDLGWVRVTVLYISARASLLSTTPPSSPHGQICRPGRVIPSFLIHLSVLVFFFGLEPFWNLVSCPSFTSTRSQPSLSTQPSSTTTPTTTTTTTSSTPSSSTSMLR